MRIASLRGAFLSAAIVAQTIAFDRPESWAMKYFASASTMTPLGAPRGMPFPSVRLGLEGDWVPYVSEAQRTVGFEGTKVEDLNRVPVSGRLRLEVGLPEKLSVTIGYLPPIPVNQVRAHLFSVAVERPFAITQDATVGLGAYATVGTIRGPFTCPSVGGAFDCEAVSDDAFQDVTFSGAVSGAYRIRPALGLEPFVTVAVNAMDLSFEVNAAYAGIVDRTALRTRGATFSATAGLRLPIATRFDLAAEAFYTPLTVDRPSGPAGVEGLFNVRALFTGRVL